MITAWTHHLKDPSERLQYEKSLRNSRWILDRLHEIMHDMDNSLDRQEISPSSYDNPNWAYKQAHSNGFRQCLSKISKLINLDLKENNDPRELTQPGRPSSND